MSNNVDLNLCNAVVPAGNRSPLECLESLIPARGCRRLVVTYLGDMDLIRTLGNKAEIERICQLTIDAFNGDESIARFMVTIPRSIVDKGHEAVLDTLLKTAINSLKNSQVYEGVVDENSREIQSNLGLIAPSMEMAEDDALIFLFESVVCPAIEQAAAFLESIEHLSNAEAAKEIRKWMKTNSAFLKGIREVRVIGEKSHCMGVVPSEIDQNQFPNLRKLILIDNGLTVIPETITKLPLLEDLRLSGNQLKALPDDLSGLKSLKTLNVCGNQLEKLPDSLGDLPLTWLSICGNPESILQSPCIKRLREKGCTIFANGMQKA